MNIPSHEPPNFARVSTGFGRKEEERANERGRSIWFGRRSAATTTLSKDRACRFSSHFSAFIIVDVECHRAEKQRRASNHYFHYFFLFRSLRLLIRRHLRRHDSACPGGSTRWIDHRQGRANLQRVLHGRYTRSSAIVRTDYANDYGNRDASHRSPKHRSLAACANDVDTMFRQSCRRMGWRSIGS